MSKTKKLIETKKGSSKSKKLNSSRKREFVKLKYHLKMSNIQNVLTNNIQRKSKILSSGNTGSRALIISLPVRIKDTDNYKNKGKYIVSKITPVRKSDITTMNNAKNTSIYAEIHLHRFVTDLYYNSITPHIMLYFTHYELRLEHFPNFLKKKLLNINNTYSDMRYFTILQETWGGDLKALESFHDWVKKHKDDRSRQKDFRYILFHILYTLECFNKVNFKHNDLHLGNILILKYKVNKKRFRQYCVTDSKGKNELYYRLPYHVPWDTRLIDFDRAWKGKQSSVKKQFRKEIDNRSLSISGYDNAFGQSRRKNQKFDTYKFLFSLYKKLPEWHETKIWIRSVIKETLIRNGYINNVKVIDSPTYGHLVHPRNGGNFEPSNTYMMSTEDMLRSSYFNVYKLDKKPKSKVPSFYSMKNIF